MVEEGDRLGEIKGCGLGSGQDVIEERGLGGGARMETGVTEKEVGGAVARR